MFDLNLPASEARAWFDQECQPKKIDFQPNLEKYGRPVSSGNPALNFAGYENKLVNINEQRFGPMIGQSLPLRQAFEKISRTAPSVANVIIYGESGTGKELAAQTIHNLSPRRHKRFVPVNCGAIPEDLIESEFFGYTKGAFTGAAMNKPGYLDWAGGGTLFLDEIGELSLSMQVKLLRAVDGGGYAPIGSQEVKIPDIRIIAATNRDLRENVRNGMMREDFYYRINVLPIWIPPLRERKGDLPLLINHFLMRFTPEGLAIPIILPDVMTLLEAYHWPGNIRELQNIIQRYVTLKEIGFLKPPLKTVESTPTPLPEFRHETDLRSAMERFESDYITHCLKAVNGHQGKACTILNINRKTLYKKMRRYNLEKIYSQET